MSAEVCMFLSAKTQFFYLMNCGYLTRYPHLVMLVLFLYTVRPHDNPDVLHTHSLVLLHISTDLSSFHEKYFFKIVRVSARSPA